MPDWKDLMDVNPEPSLLDAIAFAEGRMNIHIRDGDGFVSYLRTLPDAKAVELVKKAVRDGNAGHNQRELFRAHGFIEWMKDMVKSGALLGEG